MTLGACAEADAEREAGPVPTSDSSGGGDVRPGTKRGLSAVPRGVAVVGSSAPDTEGVFDLRKAAIPLGDFEGACEFESSALDEDAVKPALAILEGTGGALEIPDAAKKPWVAEVELGVSAVISFT